MTIKNSLIRWFLALLWRKFPYQYKDVLLGGEYHVHRNPKKKVVTI